MAMIKCRECGKEVSTQARICPSCGVAKPGKKKTHWLMVFGVLAVLGILGNLVVPTDRVGNSNKASTQGNVVAPTVATTNRAVKTNKASTQNPACSVTKANGTLDPRECDLVELCKDRDFLEKKVREARSVDAQMGSQQDLYKVENWLKQYRTEDVMAVCSGAYKQSVHVNAPVQEVQGSGCNRSPFEIFQIGQIIRSTQLTKLIDSNCPGAVFSPAEYVVVKWAGQGYKISTSKQPFDGVEARYEISGVRAAD